MGDEAEISPGYSVLKHVLLALSIAMLLPGLCSLVYMAGVFLMADQISIAADGYLFFIVGLWIVSFGTSAAGIWLIKFTTGR